MRPYQLDQSQISARQPQPQVDRHLTRSSLSNPSYMFWNTFRTVLKHKHRAHDILTVLSQTGSAPGCSGILHADTAMTWPRLSMRLTAAQQAGGTEHPQWLHKRCQPIIDHKERIALWVR